MLYRPFGRTGKELSVISFGGMRFADPANLDASAALLQHAFRQGINYFDTAPVYCGDRSEEIFGHALRDLPREEVYISSKCSRATGDELRKSLERSLRRLNLERIDFFYIWCLMNEADWRKRLDQGAVSAALQARDEGLISHLLSSSHMPGDGLAEVLREEIFEGVLLGYNALNFPYRQAAVDQAGASGIGVVTMNPLGGGLIPRNPKRFSFLKQNKTDSVISAALRFNLSHPEVTSALVGFANLEEIDQAVAAADSFQSSDRTEYARLLEHNEPAFDGLCTGCGYCLPCPVDIPIPQYLDAYNQLLLSGGDRQVLTNRFRLHWGITPGEAARCTRCGACEKRCTQHLPIIERLAELSQ